MGKLYVFLICLCFFYSEKSHSQAVTILHNNDVPQEAYAARKISETLVDKGYTITSSHTTYDYLISLALHEAGLKAEAFSIIPEGKIITIYGGDNRGLIYLEWPRKGL